MPKNYKQHNDEIFERISNSEESVNGDKEFSSKDGTRMIVRIANSEGYEQSISTLTKVKADIVDQKIYGEELSNFVNITSESAYADTLTYWTETAVADKDGSSSADGATAQGSNVSWTRDQENVKIKEWRKGYDAGHTQLNQAQMTGNRSALMSLERSYESTKKAYMQSKFFKGLGSNHKGLLNMDGVVIDTTTLTKNLSAMTNAELEVIFADMVAAYQENCFYTALPNVLLVSRQQLTQLGRIYSEFNIQTVAEMLAKSMQAITQNPNFRVVATLFADTDYSPQGLDTYMLYNDERVFFDVPVDVEALYPKGLDIRADKLMRTSEVYAERPQEVLLFTVAGS